MAQFAGLVHLFVATRAQCDQILFFIAARSAAELEVMYLQILHAAADLWHRQPSRSSTMPRPPIDRNLSEVVVFNS